MRYVKYGGETFITSDAVARALLALTASVAATSGSEVVTILAIEPGSDEPAQVDLVIGSGIHILSRPAAVDIPEPDFEDAVGWLQLHPDFPRRQPESDLGSNVEDPSSWNDDFGGAIDII
ncbi:hypothetical protein ACU6RU_09355 [Microbacterium sp. F1-18]|jgi:hypothetical protein|uniref:hypothetical protein n=1 Tax=unclassified Microbacterium TaxID=2609290 RepID=UPI000FEE608F|nr:hypothetical protein [Microbacterium sp. AG238]RKE60481.1 hypothetical protein DEU36_2924 [Microbacterium sp. AG238]